MKSIKFLAVLAAVAGIWACTNKVEPQTPGGKTGDDPEDYHESIAASPSSISFEAEGGTRRASITGSAGAYTVSGNPEWLTYEINGEELSLTASKNTETHVRECTLTIKGKVAEATISVSQKAGSAYDGFTTLSKGVLEYIGTGMYDVTHSSVIRI